MGTRFELVLHGDGLGPLAPIGEQAIDLILGLDQRLSLFRRESFLSFVNARAAGAAVPLDADLFELLVTCREVWGRTAGAFDPTVAGRMRALGLHEGSVLPGGVHAAVEGKGVRGGASVSMGDVELDASRRTVRYLRPGVAMDLGAVAKGFALDLVARELRLLGVRDALVHGGTSSILGMGVSPTGEAWRVAIGPGEDAPVVALGDAVLSLSAPRGRSVEGADGSRRITHILDPRTGMPAGVAAGASRDEHVEMAAVVRRVACAGGDGGVWSEGGWAGTLCEAWSTAAVVMGGRPRGLEETFTTAILRGCGEGARWEIDGADAGLIRVARLERDTLGASRAGSLEPTNPGEIGPERKRRGMVHV
jgi:thiamine biosynthesis lipoprotein